MLMKTYFKHRKFNMIYKAVTLMLAAVMLFSTIMTGTLAWQDFSQHKTNVASGSDIAQTVLLQKYEKDANGVVTTVTVKDAEFYLYDDSDTQIGGRYVTDENGKINISSIEPGDYYFLETNPSYAYTYDKDGENKIDKYPFTVKNTDVNVVVHAFNRRITADLIVTKEVKNVDGTALTGDQLAVEFAFTITFSDGGTYPYTIDGVNKTTLASGRTIKLKHGEKALFTGLPVGVLYTVTEAPVPGYVISCDNHQGNIPSGGVTAKFVNTYDSRIPQTGSLSVSKIVTGPGADQEKDFIFAVIFSDGKRYNYKIGGDTKTPDSNGKFTLRHNQTAIFDNLPVGITYTVAEDDYHPQYITSSQNTTGIITKDGAVATFTNRKTMVDIDTGFLAITKQVTGNGDKNRAFDFTVTFNDGGTYTYYIGDEEHTFVSGGKLSLKHGQTAIFAQLPVNLHYTVTEDDYSTDGYTTRAENTSGIIILDEFATAVFTNHKPGQDETTLIVKKKVAGKIPQTDTEIEFNFTVVINGAETKFKLKDGQQKSFTLPYGAVYEVIEDNYIDDGYSQSTITNGYGTANGQTIEVIKTNTFVGTLMALIKGEKTWDMSADQSVSKPDSIIVYLKNGDRIVESKTITPDSNGKWFYAFTAPKYDSEGKIIDYTVEEKPVAGFDSVVNGYNIKNIYVPVTSVKVTKKWVGKNPNQPKSVQVRLYKNGTAYGQLVTLNAVNAWTHTWNGLDNNAKWTVDEPNVPEGYTKQITGSAKDGFIIHNIFDKEAPPPATGTVTISGSKTWNHGSNPLSAQPKSITITLKDQYGVVLQKEISEANHWSWAFVVDKYDPNGNEYIYSIDEVSVPEYTKHIEGYNIINNHESYAEVTISGHKTWEHVGNTSKQPDSITVYVKNGDKIVAEKVITEDNGWAYSFTLPKADNNGKEANYTIDEANVPYYAMTRDGYNMTNTFKGYDYPGDNPKTGDSDNPLLWMILMLCSLTTLVVMLVLGRKSRYKGKHI